MGWRQPACLGSFEDLVRGGGGAVLSPSGSAVSTGRNSSWTSAGGPQRAGGMKTKPGEAKMGPQRLRKPCPDPRQEEDSSPAENGQLSTHTGCSCWLCQHPPAYRAWQSPCPPPATADPGTLPPSPSCLKCGGTTSLLRVGGRCAGVMRTQFSHVAKQGLG